MLHLQPRKSLLAIISLLLAAVIFCSAANVPPEVEAPSVKVVEQVQSAPLAAATASAQVETKSDNKQAAQASSSGDSGLSEINLRKGRADPQPLPADSSSKTAAASDQAASSKSTASSADKQPTEKPTEKPAATPAKTPDSKASEKPKTANSNPKSILAGKLPTKSKLPANLGTVTSTGSGGPTHYMSKHDAYSAIAEKHGALAHDAMIKKADKRQSAMHNYGGIQKASGGIGDMLSPFKGVTDTGLARTLGASMRSIMKSKYSVPAYVASALLGAVALMAFYESPISPLPVPPLPEPPIGRFPPEMPIISPNAQVPFRGNQQQQQYGQQNNYQRSFNQAPQQFASYQPQASLAGSGSQVLFPGSQQVAQQRQMTSSGPVQQLAANLLSAKPTAQRKSSPDYDQSSSRSFFGAAQIAADRKVSQAPANQQQQKSANSFLSYFGFGSDQPAIASSGSQSTNLASSSNQLANGIAQMSGSSLLEPKGGASSSNLSGSHLVNKVKSLFSRAPVSSGSASASASISAANANPYDQYQRMSIMQAFMKDAAFLPGYLTPSRKSSTGNAGLQQSVGNGNKVSSSSPSAAAAATSMNQPLSSSASIGPAARMQTSGSELINQFIGALPQQQQQMGAQKPQKSSSSGYGLVKAADRIAHALLETFSSGIAQSRHAPVSSSQSVGGGGQQNGDARKSVDNVSPLVSATSLLSDIVTSYSNNQAVASEQQSTGSVTQQSSSDNVNNNNKEANSNQQQQQQQISSRSLEVGPLESDHSNDNQKQQQVVQGQSLQGSQANPEHQKQQSPSQQQQVVGSANNNEAQSSASSTSSSSSSSQVAHVRKTRSLGIEYPIEGNQALMQKDQQPSKATQINNLIDLVSDSYSQNKMLFNFVMNQVGLSQAVPYVEQIHNYISNPPNL